MLVSTQGFVLHTTPYAETSVVAKVFTRQLGLRSYMVKGVRTARGRVKQNLLQPLSCLDMVVYDNPRTNLDYVKELAPRQPAAETSAVGNAMRFFMAEVLYKSLGEAEPMPALWDYVEGVNGSLAGGVRHLPVTFLLTVARHLGIEPLDNCSAREPYFCVQEGCFVAAPNETTLSLPLSDMLHCYLSRSGEFYPAYALVDRSALIDALLDYFQLHRGGFNHFHSNEILHIVLK